MLFVIMFFAILIYIINLIEKKDIAERESLQIKKDYFFIKYKNSYCRFSKDKLIEICKVHEKEYLQKSQYYHNYIKKHGIKNYFDEYVVAPDTDVPFQYVELYVRDNFPELFYKYNCAKWLLNDYKLGNDRVDFEYWLYDSRYHCMDLFGYYFS